MLATAGDCVTRILCSAVLAVFLSSVLPARAEAQTKSTRIDSQRGAELSLFGGAAADADDLGGSFGWSMAWRPSDRVAIEGSGSWTPTLAPDGFAALFGPRIYLNTSGRTAPFVTIEAGLFHASVDRTKPGVSDFYLDRMPLGSPETAFNDFVAAGGGGLDVRVKGRLWARPHARFLVVVDGWRTYLVAVAGLHLSYRFTALGTGP